MDVFLINEYRYRVYKNVFKVYFYAREDSVANEMKELYEKGMGVKLIFKKKKQVCTTRPPYVKEQEQLECLRKGIEK